MKEIKTQFNGYQKQKKSILTEISDILKKMFNDRENTFKFTKNELIWKFRFNDINVNNKYHVHVHINTWNSPHKYFTYQKPLPEFEDCFAKMEISNLNTGKNVSIEKIQEYAAYLKEKIYQFNNYEIHQIEILIKRFFEVHKESEKIYLEYYLAKKYKLDKESFKKLLWTDMIFKGEGRFSFLPYSGNWLFNKERYGIIGDKKKSTFTCGQVIGGNNNALWLKHQDYFDGKIIDSDEKWVHFDDLFKMECKLRLDCFFIEYILKEIIDNKRDTFYYLKQFFFIKISKLLNCPNYRAYEHRIEFNKIDHTIKVNGYTYNDWSEDYLKDLKKNDTPIETLCDTIDYNITFNALFRFIKVYLPDLVGDNTEQFFDMLNQKYTS